MNTAKNTSEKPTTCRCGCGVQSKSNYRPGHDARHAGQVGRALASAATRAEQERLIGTLPSKALRAKAVRVADKAQAKAKARSEREFLSGRRRPTTHSPQVVTAKVGRWVREGRIEGNEFVYTDKSGAEKRATKFEVA